MVLELKAAGESMWTPGQSRSGQPAGEQPVLESPTLEDFLKELGEEYEQVQKELKEMGILIQQSSSEIEKLVQRNTQIANRMRQIETNFETFPREDIKNTYTVYHEAQMRLFMMRSQLEQLENKQESLGRYAQRLRAFLSFSGDLNSITPQASEQKSQFNETQKALIVQIIQAQENERQHLARQMHDGPAQSLSNLILQAEICERLFEQDPSQARSELKNLKNAVNATFQKTRSFIFDLRPMMLDDLGLVPTLKRYVEDFEAKTECKISLSVFGSENRFAPHLEVIIFRAIQALLDNVRRHAQASHAQVTLDIHDGRITVTVEDDGSGFNVDEALQAAEGRKVLGLTNVMDQVKMLGGTFDLDSQIGRGTRVRFSIPVS